MKLWYQLSKTIRNSKLLFILEKYIQGTQRRGLTLFPGVLKLVCIPLACLISRMSTCSPGAGWTSEQSGSLNGIIKQMNHPCVNNGGIKLLIGLVSSLVEKHQNLKKKKKFKNYRSLKYILCADF